MRNLCLFLFCLALSNVTFGQDSRADLFGGYSYVNIDTNGLSSRQNANGWEASISGNFNKWFAVEAAVNGFYKSYGGISVSDYSYLAGPRFNFKPLFFHALVGGDDLIGSASQSSGNQSGLAAAFGGGVQWKVSGPFSVRGSVDYALTRHNILGGSSVTQNNVRVSVGIVYSFGGRSGGERQVSAPPTHTEPRPIPPSAAPSAKPTYHQGASMQVAALGLALVSGRAEGAEIVEVVHGSVADWAGLQPGDVINGVDGKTIRTPMELAAELSGRSVGEKVRLAVMVRGYWQTETTLVLGGQK